MVDVHTPDFFALGLSLKTPPVIGASAEMGASAQGGNNIEGSPPRIPRARPGRALSVYATHIKITGFSIVKIKRVTVSYF